MNLVPDIYHNYGDYGQVVTCLSTWHDADDQWLITWVNSRSTCGQKYWPSKYKTLIQDWFIVGPSSATLAQQWTSFGSMSRVSRGQFESIVWRGWRFSCGTADAVRLEIKFRWVGAIHNVGIHDSIIILNSFIFMLNLSHLTIRQGAYILTRPYKSTVDCGNCAFPISNR